MKSTAIIQIIESIIDFADRLELRKYISQLEDDLDRKDEVIEKMTLIIKKLTNK